jgi:hypothetical protein
MAWQRLKIPPVGSVCGRRRFHSQDAAEMARKVTVARPLDIYWCSKCSALHLQLRKPARS